MKYLLAEQIKSFLRPGKEIDYFLGASHLNGFPIFRWISICRDGEHYFVAYHEVFDDRDEGIDDIYDFSYVEPDDLHGKELFDSISFEEVKRFLNNEFQVNWGKFSVSGALNELINL